MPTGAFLMMEPLDKYLPRFIPLGWAPLGNQRRGKERSIDKIKRDGGAVDCFGKKLVLSERKHDARKILAQIAQAIELNLIYPVFQLAKNTTDFKVMILQHDGAMIHFLRREARWKKQLESVVCIEAQRMGSISSGNGFCCPNLHMGNSKCAVFIRPH